MWKGQALRSWVLLAGVAMAAVGVHGVKIIVKEASGKVFLQCIPKKENEKPKEVVWTKDGETVSNEMQLDLGAIYDDPRGTYTCSSGSSTDTLQVHYRMCQNCIEVDAPTISGIVIADVVATVFLAIAVYCITGQDKGRMSRASDRQNLIANEQLYQPLGERDDGQYSRLAPAKARK